MWVLVRICYADVRQFNVEELINRMQCTTYAIQKQNVLLIMHLSETNNVNSSLLLQLTLL